VPLVIRPREGVALAANLAGLAPDQVAADGAAAVALRPVDSDAGLVPLGELCDVEGSAADGVVEWQGDLSLCNGVAAGMREGRVVVRGPAGRGAGAGMTGGRLEVDGDAGDWLAAGMGGGVVHVRGDAGDDLASAPPGADVGVTGGTVLVEGSAGRRAGGRMRRGIVAIGGDCGPAAGIELRAGTILVCGRLGVGAGTRMRRGSIVALGPHPGPGPTFLPGGRWHPTVFGVLSRHLAAVGFGPLRRGPESLSHPFRQWHGDTLAGGRGELLLRTAD